jgi:hypothetical protein
VAVITNKLAEQHSALPLVIVAVAFEYSLAFDAANTAIAMVVEFVADLHSGLDLVLIHYQYHQLHCQCHHHLLLPFSFNHYNLLGVSPL